MLGRFRLCTTLFSGYELSSAVSCAQFGIMPMRKTFAFAAALGAVIWANHCPHEIAIYKHQISGNTKVVIFEGNLKVEFTKYEGFTLRMATVQDVDAILALITELAIYEEAEDAVAATPEILREWLFEKNAAEVLLAELPDGRIAGMGLFFQNYSTWTGKGGMYLEDFVVSADCRGRGIGTAILRELALICEDRGWIRFDWACLDWNTPSLEYYVNRGAVPMKEWVHFRLEGDALRAVAHGE